jgi:hypothetical protein
LGQLSQTIVVDNDFKQEALAFGVDHAASKCVRRLSEFLEEVFQ